MNRGQRVRIKLLATNADNEYRGRTGTVIMDSAPGEVVIVEFDDEAVSHQFIAEDLEPVS